MTMVAQPETERQIFHFAIGVVAIAMLLYLGRTVTMAVVFGILIAGSIMMNLRLLGKRIPIISQIEKRLERQNAPLPGWGSACYAAGVLIIVTALTNTNQIAACIAVLAVGDSVSTLVGMRGRIKLPYHRSKTLEGTMAFFISALPAAYFFIGPAAVPLAITATVVETIPKIEDNLGIPLASVAVLTLIKAITGS